MNRLGLTLSCHKPVEPQSIAKIIYLPQIPVRSPRWKVLQPQMAYSCLLWVAFSEAGPLGVPIIRTAPKYHGRKLLCAANIFILATNKDQAHGGWPPPEVGERARFSSALGILPRVGANMDRQLVWMHLIKTPRKHQIWLMLKAHPCGNTQRSRQEGRPYEASPA